MIGLTELRNTERELHAFRTRVLVAAAAVLVTFVSADTMALNAT